MKRVSKTTGTAACVLLMCAALWAQDEGAKEDSSKVGTVKFSNVFHTTVVRVTDGDIDEPDFYDQMKATFSNEKIFAFIKARARLTRGDKNGGGEFTQGDWEGIQFKRSKFDWTIKYMPIKDLGLAMHETNYIPGTYIVVDDDNVHGGNIASHGFTVSYTGVPGLTLAASVPFDLQSDKEEETHDWDRDHNTNYFNGGEKTSCTGYTFRMGGGAYYENDFFSIGAAFHEIGRNDFSGGAYFTLSPVEVFKFYGGYSYKNKASYIYEAGYDKETGEYDHDYVNVNHVFNASFEFTPDIFVFAADYVGNVQNDIYAAVRFGVNVTDNTLVKVEGLYFSKNVAKLEEKANGDDPMFRIYPDVKVEMGKAGSLEVGAKVWFEASDFAYIEFPIYWSYDF